MLWNIYAIGRGARNISIKKWEIYFFKIKIILFIINFRRNNAICYGQVLVQNGASASEEFALFNWSSVGYISDLPFVQNKDYQLEYLQFVYMISSKIL